MLAKFVFCYFMIGACCSNNRSYLFSSEKPSHKIIHKDFITMVIKELYTYCSNIYVNKHVPFYIVHSITVDKAKT